ncbi:Protein kinase-like domain [Pseudocohnilembus persalinus]|uniref:Protein kinase-like domain n=1 Tax=Pseudocohnilembus persalinus TaxID=266149 RepID=A0A0V0QT21_PSEPJ|nr:Protein kinase-like domain [Pseudocohnilembus persalinus]|eukprot:KRX05366.1 Protein kinase-like domain [Pseudocohnilembus persalinus]
MEPQLLNQAQNFQQQYQPIDNFHWQLDLGIVIQAKNKQTNDLHLVQVIQRNMNNNNAFEKYINLQETPFQNFLTLSQPHKDFLLSLSHPALLKIKTITTDLFLNFPNYLLIYEPPLPQPQSQPQSHLAYINPQEKQRQFLQAQQKKLNLSTKQLQQLEIRQIIEEMLQKNNLTLSPDAALIILQERAQNEQKERQALLKRAPLYKNYWLPLQAYIFNQERKVVLNFQQFSKIKEQLFALFSYVHQQKAAAFNLKQNEQWEELVRQIWQMTAPLYRAPEFYFYKINQLSELNLQKQDIWSLGSVLFYLKTQKNLWQTKTQARNLDDLFDALKYYSKDPSYLEFSSQFSNNLQRNLRQMLDINPDNRSSIEDIICDQELNQQFYQTLILKKKVVPFLKRNDFILKLTPSQL